MVSLDQIFNYLIVLAYQSVHLLLAVNQSVLQTKVLGVNVLCSG